jgi:hypothetical protein
LVKKSSNQSFDRAVLEAAQAAGCVASLDRSWRERVGFDIGSSAEDTLEDVEQDGEQQQQQQNDEAVLGSAAGTEGEEDKEDEEQEEEEDGDEEDVRSSSQRAIVVLNSRDSDSAKREKYAGQRAVVLKKAAHGYLLVRVESGDGAGDEIRWLGKSTTPVVDDATAASSSSSSSFSEAADVDSSASAASTAKQLVVLEYKESCGAKNRQYAGQTAYVISSNGGWIEVQLTSGPDAGTTLNWRPRCVQDMAAQSSEAQQNQQQREEEEEEEEDEDEEAAADVEMQDEDAEQAAQEHSAVDAEIDTDEQGMEASAPHMDSGAGAASTAKQLVVLDYKESCGAKKRQYAGQTAHVISSSRAWIEVQLTSGPDAGKTLKWRPTCVQDMAAQSSEAQQNQQQREEEEEEAGGAQETAGRPAAAAAAHLQSKWGFVSASVGSAIASAMSCGPVVVYVESAAGIKEGGRTGLTAVVASLCFAVSLFLIPVLRAVPPAATAPVQILVGAMMLSEVNSVNWREIFHGIPAFLTLMMMPFTFSISDGLLFGCGASIALFFLTGRFLELLPGRALLGGGGSAGSRQERQPLLVNAPAGSRGSANRSTWQKVVSYFSSSDESQSRLQRHPSLLIPREQILARQQEEARSRRRAGGDGGSASIQG